MPKLTTLLGWGAAKEAGEKIKKRKSRLETALEEQTSAAKPKKPKGSFKPKGKKRLQQGGY